jgi:hypothetical protein
MIVSFFALAPSAVIFLRALSAAIDDVSSRQQPTPLIAISRLRHFCFRKIIARDGSGQARAAKREKKR